MDLLSMDAKTWNEYAEMAHLIVFNENRPAELNRIDFAMITDIDATPQCYMTCRELDSESVYMQYGGAFPSCKGTTKSFTSYEMFVTELAQKYKRATTLISNQNIPMLKFAMKIGLRVIGIRIFKNEVFLELMVEFGGHDA